MKKYILTLALGLVCAVGFAQDYVVVNQGTIQNKYLLKEVTAISHTADAVTIEQGQNTFTYPVADVDSITFVKALDTTIPQDLLDELDDYMPIYYGDTPPNIEGVYREHTTTLVYDSSGGYSPGSTFIDMIFKFFNQDMMNNVLDYRALEVYTDGSIASDETSLESYIMGNGNNFTVYFNISGNIYYGQDYDLTMKQAIIISGTKAEDGIRNQYYSFVMVDKSDDPDHTIVDVGTIRVFYDSDGWSETTTWPLNGLKFNVNKNADELPGLLSMPKK